MEDVINLLLKKQATLKEDCEFAKKVECEKIDAAFADRNTQITDLLNRAGYVPPVVETVEAVEVADAEEVETVEETATVIGMQVL